MTMPIRYLTNDQLDKDRWDQCIRESIHSSLYGFSWYLDAVSPGWEALVEGDYHAVMPLTGRKKWGISYLYRPLLTQQTGIFSLTPTDELCVSRFLDHIPPAYRLIEVTLNRHNVVRHPEFDMSPHTSYVLDLQPEYAELKKQYSQNTRRNLKKSWQNNLDIIPDLEAERWLNLMQQDQGAGTAILLQPNNQRILKELVQTLQQKNSQRIIGVQNAEGNLLAAALFGINQQQYVYLAPVSSNAGREMRSQFFLIDYFIQTVSGKPYVLDFEGSDIPGVARFYAGFGATAYTYPFIRRNKLPGWVRLIKRIVR